MTVIHEICAGVDILVLAVTQHISFKPDSSEWSKVKMSLGTFLVTAGILSG